MQQSFAPQVFSQQVTHFGKEEGPFLRMDLMALELLGELSGELLEGISGVGVSDIGLLEGVVATGVDW